MEYKIGEKYLILDKWSITAVKKHDIRVGLMGFKFDDNSNIPFKASSDGLYYFFNTNESIKKTLEEIREEKLNKILKI